MNCEYIAKGKTIDEAVENGLAKIGLERDDVSIEVIETPEKGFLGIGASPAVVKLSYEGIEPIIPEGHAEAKPDKASEKEAAKAAKEAAKAEKEAAKAEKNKKSDFVKASSSTEFATKMIELMGVADVTVSESETEDGKMISVDGENAGSLIGHRGETLNALQYLISLYDNREHEEYSRVNFDVLGYREKRKVTLEKLARRMAITAVKTRRNIYLDPMPNYERKIIHASLQDFNGVTTYSTGSEPNRKVVIAYNGNRSHAPKSEE